MRFRRDDRGSIAVPFGLSLFAFVGAVALSVDMARVLAARTSLQQMADAATLTGAVHLGDSTSLALAKARDTFDSQSAKHTKTITRTISLTQNNAAVAAYASAQVEMYFGRAIGNQFVTVDAYSEALFQTGHLDVFLMLDVSASMGLAASPAEMTKLKGLTKPHIDAWASSAGAPGWAASYVAENGCAFACHSREGWEPNGGSALDFARANAVQLRWDVVTDAARKMAETLLDTNTQQGTTGVIRLGAYVFGDRLDKILDPTKSITNVTFNSTSLLQFNTKLNAALGEVVVNVGASGSGFDPASPKKVVVLATDGVSGLRGWPHEPVDVTKCDQIKAAGITIAVIDVKYVKDLASPFFVTDVLPIYDQLSPALQACASSSDLYIQATDAASIQSAFKAMAGRVSNLRPRLTK